jgi:hypothetical protein
MYSLRWSTTFLSCFTSIGPSVCCGVGADYNLYNSTKWICNIHLCTVFHYLPYCFLVHVFLYRAHPLSLSSILNFVCSSPYVLYFRLHCIIVLFSVFYFSYPVSFNHFSLFTFSSALFHHFVIIYFLTLHLLSCFLLFTLLFVLHVIYIFTVPFPSYIFIFIFICSFIV